LPVCPASLQLLKDMTTQIETTGTLERKLSLTVPMAEVTKTATDRLRKLSKTVKMPGFRPGKVPLKMVEQSYGGQGNAEVMGDAVSKAFSDAVAEHDLRVAGQPSIDNAESGDEAIIAFTATFEVYPEVPAVDPSTLEIDKLTCEVTDAEIDRTLEILRKQRVTWEGTDRAAQEGDQVTIDFLGTLDGEPFDGGSADGFAFILGEGRMLADFETGVTGQKTGAVTKFPVTFPEDYSAENLAGKTAEFDVTLQKVEAPVLPEVDAEFAKTLGVENGSLETMRKDIETNLGREVGQRIRAGTKNNVMDALASQAGFELPKALVDGERETLIERAKQDMAGRGMSMDDIPIPDDAFREQAEKRVRLGLLVAEIVKREELQAKPDQIRTQIEEFAQAYENPGEVVRHYFSDRERLGEIEAIVIEQNVVDWAMAKAKVSDKPMPFDELMGAQA